MLEGGAMDTYEFDQYLDHLAPALAHADRVSGLKDYCTGLMLPLQRKSVEPLAAHLDPLHVSAKHQTMLHFVGQSDWSDEAMLDRVFSWVEPLMARTAPAWFWIVDDTGNPKKGKHSVGVARQYCGQVGKQDNCQVAVSLSLATEAASVPIAWRLYLPQQWCDDARRRQAAGVPESVTFATKPELALQQIWAAKTAAVPVGVVLADAAYGNECAFREALEAMELHYAVGIGPATSVWAPGTAPLPPRPYGGRGIRPTALQRGPGHEPVPVKELALQLAATAWHTVAWREGTNNALSSRFALLRVRPAHRDYNRSQLRAEVWLLIEWPDTEDEPTKYWLSNLAADMAMEQLVATAKMRWRIERDYEELKQEFGLGHYEGRGWRGFHHHASLCIAAYGFLLGQRLRQKKALQRQVLALPESYRPRGAGARAASRA
jgi:SRSO17 transposase